MIIVSDCYMGSLDLWGYQRVPLRAGASKRTVGGFAVFGPARAGPSTYYTSRFDRFSGAHCYGDADHPPPIA